MFVARICAGIPALRNQLPVLPVHDGAGDVHPHDLSTILDRAGVAICAEYHCTQLLHQYLVAQSTARANLSFYNTCKEIDVFITTLKEAIEFFGSIFG